LICSFFSSFFLHRVSEAKQSEEEEEKKQELITSLIRVCQIQEKKQEKKKDV